MTGDCFVYVGSWNIPTPPKPGGITLLRFSPRNGVLSYVESFAEEVNIGSLVLDHANACLYATDERLSSYGTPGGTLLSFALDRQTGIPEERCRTSSLGAYPSKIALAPDGEHLLVTNLSGFSSICRSVRREDGSYTLHRKYDESNLVLFRHDRDGSRLKAVDLTVCESPERSPLQTHAMLHSVTASPDGTRFLVCDRGADAVRLYHLDTDAERLICTDASPTSVPGSGPRYAAFHPTLSCVYYNCELLAYLCVCPFTAEGRLEAAHTLNLLPEGMSVPPDLGLRERPAPSDLVLSPDGKYLYAALRVLNELLVCALEPENGLPTLVQRITCGGTNPRALAVDPTGQFLLCANLDSQEIAVFHIGADGTLSDSGQRVSVRNPGSIVFASDM